MAATEPRRAGRRRRLGRSLAGIAAGASAAWALVACGPPAPAAPTPRPAIEVARTLPGPDFELLGLDGELHRLSAFRGRILLINFWATWCLACREEMPALERLHRAYAERGVAVVGIATDREGRSVVEPYLQEMAVSYPILLDPEAVSASLFGGLTGYPSTFVLDADGLIYSSYLGAQEEATFAEDLRYLLQAEASGGAELPAGALAEDPPPP
ncbi:MAG: TlpA disulfide reductase family protein [Acidobacteriota bacterium]